MFRVQFTNDNIIYFVNYVLLPRNRARWQCHRRVFFSLLWLRKNYASHHNRKKNTFEKCDVYSMISMFFAWSLELNGFFMKNLSFFQIDLKGRRKRIDVRSIEFSSSALSLYDLFSPRLSHEFIPNRWSQQFITVKGFEWEKNYLLAVQCNRNDGFSFMQSLKECFQCSK